MVMGTTYPPRAKTRVVKLTTRRRPVDKEQLSALAEVQRRIIEIRRMATEATDPRKRDACLRVADAFEKRARELDTVNPESS